MPRPYSPLAARLAVLAVALCAALLSSCAAPERPGASLAPTPPPARAFAILGGVASLDGEFGEFDSPTALGLEISTDGPPGSIGWEAGLLHTGEDGRDGTLRTVRSLELYFGARKGLHLGPYTLHAGAGLSYLILSTDQNISDPGGPPIDFVAPSNEDTSVGGYLQAGVRRRLHESVEAGIWARTRDGHGFDVAPGPRSIDSRSTALGVSVVLRF